MRVLVVAQSLDRAEFNIFHAIACSGVELGVVLDPRSPYVEPLREVAHAVSTYALDRRFDRHAVRHLRERLGEGYALVHSMTKRALISSLRASAGSDVRHVAYRGIAGNVHRWDPMARYTYLSSRLGRIICVCEAVRAYLLSVGVPADHAVTIHKGHAIDWYTELAKVPRESFEIPSEAFVVGCSARMDRRKGLDVLIRALSELRTERPVHLLLVGHVRDRRLPGLVAHYGLDDRVHFTGFREDAPAIMGGCDLLAMPSLRREGLPRAAIETMAQGVPAVVTDVGGLPEIVEEGRSGLIVPPGDSAALTAAIATYVGDDELRRRHGRGAQQRIHTAFHYRQSVEKTLSVYRDLLR